MACRRVRQVVTRHYQDKIPIVLSRGSREFWKFRVHDVHASRPLRQPTPLFERFSLTPLNAGVWEFGILECTQLLFRFQAASCLGPRDSGGNRRQEAPKT